jgi:hypothetical protein
MKRILGSHIDIVPAVRPVDLQTGANDGDWISLKNWEGVLILFHSAIGTNGDDPTLALEQATTVAGGSSKALTKITTIWTKQAATNLLSIAGWTKVSQAVAASYTQTDAAEQEALWAVEVDAQMLDRDNGFDCIRARVADVGGNAQLGAAYYILFGPRFGATPENLPSAIVD